jgi:hypothetical protein
MFPWLVGGLVVVTVFVVFVLRDAIADDKQRKSVKKSTNESSY